VNSETMLDLPGPHPLPPANFNQRELLIKQTSQAWFRNHWCRHAPVYFNKDAWKGRFNDPAGDYGVLYLGEDEHCAFIEVYGQSDGKNISYLGDNIVTESEIDARCICPISTIEALRLVDLTAHGLARLQADNRLCTGNWTVAQQWSRAFWNHPTQPDGIYYRSRHDSSRCAIALFDRAESRLRSACTNRGFDCCASNVLRNRTKLAAILDLYGFGLISGAGNP
jgi:hypothetical protein